MSALEIFQKHFEELDSQFDDMLIIEYNHIDDIPEYKIMYDPEVCEAELRAAIPKA